MGKSKIMILSTVTLAFQKLKEQRYLNLIHIMHNLNLNFINTFSCPIPVMYIFSRSLYKADLLSLNTELDVWRVVDTWP